MVSLASDLRERVAAAGDANLEFARGGYRLSLNPFADRFDELGFILWRQEADGNLAPVAAGRAVGDELVLDGEPAAGGELADLAAVIASMLETDPVSTQDAADTA